MTQDEQTNMTPEAIMQMSNKFGYLQLLGMKIVTADGGVGRVSISIDERLLHPWQMVHGGVIFTLADTAMSMALMSVIPPETPFGTIEAKINFLLPVHTGELVAEAAVVHQGRSTAVLEATVYNIHEGERQAIARTLGTFNIVRSKKTVNTWEE